MNKFARIIAGLVTLVLVEATSVHYTPVNGVPLVTLEVPAARADAAGFGYRVLKCFHPSADFVRASFGPRYRDQNGRDSQDGSIDFRGGFTGNSYGMSFVLHRKIEDKDSYIRITIKSDDAPFAPNPSCELRDWTRVD